MSEFKPYEPFKVYLADVSYFSGKLESYMRYKEIPFERVAINASTGVSEVYANTGIRKVPAVESADGKWLKETTNMIDWFEERYTNQPIIPSDPALAFLSKLVEDYVDEWCWRSAMYWRWRSDDNARLLGSRIGKEVFSDWPIPTRWAGKLFAIRQRLIFLKGDGLRKESETAIAKQYYQLSDSLTKLLSDQPFLLGNKPTLVDIAFMGPFFRHYFCDPIPARVMRDNYPDVTEWVARMWNAKASKQPTEMHLSDFSHPGWEFILKELIQDYLPYLYSNKAAWKQGRNKFTHTTTQTTFVNIPVVHHRVYCLERLEEQYQALDDRTRARVHAVLSPYGEIMLDGNTVSGIKESYELPLKPRPPIGRWEYLQVYLFGSPWDMNRAHR